MGEGNWSYIGGAYIQTWEINYPDVGAGLPVGKPGRILRTQGKKGEKGGGKGDTEHGGVGGKKLQLDGGGKPRLGRITAK